MKQHVVHDPIAARYADGIDHVWNAWHPALRRLEGTLGRPAWYEDIDEDALAEELRRVQYRVHTSAEFAAGLAPPQSATESHRALLNTLGACRDTLSVLAIRAELGELDEESAHVGMVAARATRQAFAGARSTSVLGLPQEMDDQIESSWVLEPHQPAGTWTFLLWLAVAISTGLLGVLGIEILSAR